MLPRTHTRPRVRPLVVTDPFDGGGGEVTTLGILNARFTVPPGFSAGVGEIIHKALLSDPTERATVVEIIHLVTRAVAGVTEPKLTRSHAEAETAGAPPAKEPDFTAAFDADFAASFDAPLFAPAPAPAPAHEPGSGSWARPAPDNSTAPEADPGWAIFDLAEPRAAPEEHTGSVDLLGGLGGFDELIPAVGIAAEANKSGPSDIADIASLLDLADGPNAAATAHRTDDALLDLLSPPPPASGASVPAQDDAYAYPRPPVSAPPASLVDLMGDLNLDSQPLPAATPERVAPMLAPGTFALVVNLKSQPALNGTRASILSWDPAKERYNVALERDGRQIVLALKAQNLEV
jgi:hypothetical protein